QYLMRVPVWHWHSRFLLDFLHPLPIHGVFCLNQVNHFLRGFTKNINISSLIITEYSTGLFYKKLIIIIEYMYVQNRNTFCKVREILFPSHIEQVLQIDRKVLRKLLESEEQITSYNGNIQQLH